ncbi:MAG: AbrB family transcriptional regulator [Tardiphaga sp.]|jgi:membrane AbrB-like protein|nr:AbrB family transcriptional regulator [Xanthobacteraceae bacterium]
MAISVVSRRTMLRTAETLLIAAVGGALFTWIGFPAGLISGSLLSVAAAALAGRPLMVPAPLSRVISVLVGISLGAVATPETLKGLAAFPISIAVLLVATVLMTVATTSYLRLVHGWPWQSALFGASPGALAQVMMLAAEYRADLRAIAIVQVMRVVILTIGIPAGLAYFGLTASGAFLPKSSAGISSISELATLVGLSTGAAVGLRAVNFPGGLMFGAMLASAVLHGTGYIEAVLPWWAVAAAVIGIGAVTGSRFANTDPITLLRYLGAALGSFAVAISVASVFVLILTAVLPLRIADVVVAYAPGAQDTMMVLALALHLDPIFIGAHHLSRYLLVSLSIPLLGKWLGPPPPMTTGSPGS